MDYIRKAMAEAFTLKAKPTMFLSSMFQSPDSNKSDTIKIVFDIKRDDEDLAVDVIRGTGGRGNASKRFTTKEYEPPVYDEFSNVNENERLSRLFGRTEFDQNTMADIVAAITDDQVRLQEKINRAIEKQASDAFFLGQVPLINSDTIDFKQKVSHQITPPIAWSNSSGVPIDNLSGGSKLNRKDGKTETTDAIFGESALRLLFNNNQFKEEADFRRVDRVNIAPPMMNAEGANYHGNLSLDDYVINIWTYPQYYKVPVGFGLPNEGELVPYIPTDKVWLGNSQTRFDLVFAGIEKLVTTDPRLESIGLSHIPQIIRGDFHTYGAVDFFGQNAKYGVKSAPLCIPTNIDSFCVFTVS